MNQQQNIFLIGFMGTGKSTVAEGLKKRLGMKQVEMDKTIEKEQQMAISEIFERFGEEHFRDIETQLLKRFATGGPYIVSCGGGAVLRPENVAIMKKSGKVVLLLARPETVYERVKDSRERPILNADMSVEYISRLMEKRRAVYEAAADVTVHTDGKSVEEICEEIIGGIGSWE